MKKAITSLLEGLFETVIEIAGHTLSVDDITEFGDGAEGLLNSIWSYLIVFAIGMLIIYFLIEMNQKLALEGRDLNLKSAFAPFLKLMVGIAVLSQGARIMTGMFALNRGVANTFYTIAADTDMSGLDAADMAESLIKGTNFWSQIVLIIPVILCGLACLIISVMFVYKALLYRIELIWRVSLSPLALCDVYSGQQSNAIRWCKQLVGVIIYGGAMMVLPKLCCMIGMSTLSFATQDASGNYVFTAPSMSGVFDMLKVIFSIIVIPFAALGSLSMARQAIKEAVG